MVEKPTSGAQRDADPAAGEPAAPGWREWRPSVVQGFLTWLAAMITYALVTLVAWLPPAGDPPDPGAVYAQWNKWDVAWYTIISDLGYTWDERSPAFFPLYPMLVRLVNPVVPGLSFPAALTVSSAAGLAVMILMHRLTTVHFGEELARRAIFYVIAWPTAFLLVNAYNESLLIALALGALYLMHRGRWGWAAVVVAFAGSARASGILLVAPFLWEYLRQHGYSWRSPGRSLRGVRPDLLWILLTPTGLVVYMAYLWHAFGDPLIFRTAQDAWWRHPRPPWTGMMLGADLLTEHWPSVEPNAVRNIINMLTVVLALTLMLAATVGPWRLRGDGIYLVVASAAMFALPLCTPMENGYSPLDSLWRYVLEAPVVFMMLARLGRGFFFDRAFIMVALAMQGVMIVVFLHEQFVG
ncbi:hypothetical protein GCM10009681_29690 [Luedemannella helvata]|uniref:Mannosyltransferase n=2 Tax=Luedemannella helvata TaxID=349315 RepID=A0ABP4WSI0_9ACTN